RRHLLFVEQHEAEQRLLRRQWIRCRCRSWWEERLTECGSCNREHRRENVASHDHLSAGSFDRCWETRSPGTSETAALVSARRQSSTPDAGNGIAASRAAKGVAQIRPYFLGRPDRFTAACDARPGRRTGRRRPARAVAGRPAVAGGGDRAARRQI